MITTILFYLLEQKLQLKYDFEKELEELYRKYDIKRKEVEVEFQNIRKNLDTRNKIVFVNKILAEAFRAKSMDLKVSGASRMQQGIFLQIILTLVMLEISLPFIILLLTVQVSAEVYLLLENITKLLIPLRYMRRLLNMDKCHASIIVYVLL